MLEDHKSIEKTFNQFGFRKIGDSSDQIYGICPFCGEQKMYINEEKHLWKCHAGKCQLEGGFYTFLDLIADHCKKILIPSGKGKELSADRGISEMTLKRNNVGYNPINDSYLIPSYFHDNPHKVLNISIYNSNRKLMATSGCKLGLYGWEHITKKTETLWLCEGVWDWLVCNEILNSIGKQNDLAIGCPGAGTFKGEWGSFFTDKMVYVLYDNDEAGSVGMHKVYNNLVHYAKGLRFIHWPNKPEGYDLRDFYKDHKLSSLGTIKSVRMLLQSIPPSITTNTGKLLEVKDGDKKEARTGKRIDHEEVYKVYKKWLHLPSTDVIDILFGTIIANRLDGDPIWLFFVAPSGGTKTEMLLSVSASGDVEVISSLTPRTLVSGMTLEGGIDPSLLPKLDGKVLVIKDFTAILSMNKIHRDEILGDLRDAYDGEFSKPFGNAKWRKYKSKFGILAGVTPEIEKHLHDSVAMGERFLRYSLPIDNSIDGRKGFIRRALTNVANETEMRAAIQKIASQVVDYEYTTIPEIPDDIQEMIVCLAHWICLVRGVVSRDRYTRQVTTSPFIEVGTRVAKQLCKVALGVAMFKHKRKISLDEYKIAVDVARGSVPRDNELVFRYLFQNRVTEQTAGEIAEGLHLPNSLIDRILQDMKLTHVVKNKKISALGSKWILNDDIIELVEGSKVYE